MEFPLVSVGLPTYNRPVGLKKCLEYLLQQTYTNIEIIISDNCSTDPEVQQIILQHAARDSRIKHFRQQENIGLENNFNFLYAQSSAPYFMWMSDDDYFEANYIEECIRFLENSRDHILCSGMAKYHTGDKFLFAEKMFVVDQKTPFKRMLRYFTGVGKNANFYGVFRHGLLAEKPIGNHVGCDWSFMAKLAVLGKLNYSNTTCYYRSATGNSGSRGAMVRKFKLNWFKTVFFETYLASVVAGNIFNDAAVIKQMKWWKRKLAVIIIFFLINRKLFFNFFKKAFKKKVES